MRIKNLFRFALGGIALRPGLGVCLFTLPLACACRAHTPEAKRPFLFEYTYRAGYGEICKRLVARDKRVTFQRLSSPHREEGEAIGVFQVALREQDRQRLEKAMPDRAPQGSETQRDMPTLEFVLQSGKREARFAAAPQSAGKLPALLTEIDALEKRVLACPLRSLRFTLVPPSKGFRAGQPCALEVRATNEGTETVSFDADPKSCWLEAADVVVFTSNVMPLPPRWQSVGVLAPPAPRRKIKERETLTLTFPARFVHSGRLWLRAHYLSPAPSKVTDETLVSGEMISKRIVVEVQKP